MQILISYSWTTVDAYNYRRQKHDVFESMPSTANIWFSGLCTVIASDNLTANCNLLNLNAISFCIIDIFAYVWDVDLYLRVVCVSVTKLPQEKIRKFYDFSRFFKTFCSFFRFFENCRTILRFIIVFYLVLSDFERKHIKILRLNSFLWFWAQIK